MDKYKGNRNSEEMKKESYSDLVQQLKQRRIELGKTEEEMAKELLIPNGNITKLEQGQIFGNSSYMRMTLKKYIKALDWDYSMFEDIIKKEFPSIVEETIILNELSPEKLKKVKKDKDFKVIKKISSYIIFIIFIVFLVLITGYNFKSKLEKTQTINETTQIKETILEPDKIVEKPVEESDVKIKDNIIEVYLKDTDSVNIKIHTTGEVYLDYSKDGVIQKQGTLSENQDIEYNFQSIDNLKINIGSIEKVKISINDKDITEDLKDIVGHYYIVFKKQES